MNAIQKIFGIIFPPYRFSVIRREEGKLYNGLIAALTDEFENIKKQLASARLMGLDNGILHPDFKFTTIAYHGETVRQYIKRGQNFIITGLMIFSKRTQKYEDVSILVRNNLVVGLKITNSNYQLIEFNLQRIDGSNTRKSSFDFPPDDTDVLYDSFSDAVKERLNPDSLSEIELNNRMFYTFYDMEDGNYLAIDKKQQVYSLVHDARPVAAKMKISFLEVLNDIAEKRFNKEKHLDTRYKNPNTAHDDYK